MTLNRPRQGGQATPETVVIVNSCRVKQHTNKTHLVQATGDKFTLCKFDTTRADYKVFATTTNLADVTCGRCLRIINSVGVKWPAKLTCPHCGKVI